MLTTLSCRATTCQSIAEIQLTGVAPLRAITIDLILNLIMSFKIAEIKLKCAIEC